MWPSRPIKCLFRKFRQVFVDTEWFFLGVAHLTLLFQRKRPVSVAGRSIQNNPSDSSWGIDRGWRGRQTRETWSHRMPVSSACLQVRSLCCFLSPGETRFGEGGRRTRDSRLYLHKQHTPRSSPPAFKKHRTSSLASHYRRYFPVVAMSLVLTGRITKGRATRYVHTHANSHVLARW